MITESFNKAVCTYLAKEIEPAGRQKTLIFCVTDAHADLVVDKLKQAFKDTYGSVDDDAVIKITGSADKPLKLLRRYKNERLPNVAVTVDLLTTGIDVPEICNLVFLRRVNSRILYDQMLGRATRLCEDIGKDTFRIYDAVQIYEGLREFTDMKPVVVNPKISFSQLVHELINVAGDEEKGYVKDQLLAKLQRKKHQLNERNSQDFETVSGMSADVFASNLKTMSVQEVATWFAQNPDLAEILDRKNERGGTQLIFSEHADKLLSVERGYGKAKKPSDYLSDFTKFIQENQDKLPALVTVVTRPKDLTRQALRQLTLELDKAGFSETHLNTAYREMTNQDMAARIIGYIRQAALGEALMPFEQRVDSALKRILASQSWTTPQRDWLKRIAAQTKANLIVDRDALDDPNLIFKREGGGYLRLDRIFEGRLEQVLSDFSETIWQQAA